MQHGCPSLDRVRILIFILTHVDLLGIGKTVSFGSPVMILKERDFLFLTFAHCPNFYVAVAVYYPGDFAFMLSRQGFS